MASSSWHSYPKIFNVGHAAIADLLKDHVIVEEKVDGSQFSFGYFAEPVDNAGIKCRSKGCVLNIHAPEKMFNRAIEVVNEIAPKLVVGWTYRAEYLARPKHNTLAYDRAPEKNLMIFDINTGEEAYLSYAEKKAEAERLGLEVVPLLHEGMVDDIGLFRTILDTTSALGGQKIEGVVIKQYKRFGPDGKALFGKFVSEAFKEVHGASWKERNPGQSDLIELLVTQFRTPARWDKSIQHLRERGEIEDDPRDIGKLFKEVNMDVLAECADEIKEALFKLAWPRISRGITRGLPEFYKEKLLKKQFEKEAVL